MKRSTPAPRQRGASSLKTPGTNGFRYRERFGVIVLCTDAAHQERVYRKLLQGGHKLRVVTV